MNNHRTVLWVIEVGRYQGRCTCGERSPEHNQHWEAEDWVHRHKRNVERAKAHKTTPSLADQRDHYRRMEALTNDPWVKAQWKVLADGLDQRLGTTHHPEDAPLW